MFVNCHFDKVNICLDFAVRMWHLNTEHLVRTHRYAVGGSCQELFEGGGGLQLQVEGGGRWQHWYQRTLVVTFLVVLLSHQKTTKHLS